MKIVSITPDIDSGGSAKSLFMLSRAIRAAGHELHIASIVRPSRTKRKVEELRAAGVHVSFFDIPYLPLELVACPIPFWTNAGRTIKRLGEYRRLASYVHAIRPDVVHYNSYTTLLCSLFLGRYAGVLHAREVLIEPSRLMGGLKALIGARIREAIGITPPVSRQVLRLFDLAVNTVYNWPLEPPRCVPMPERDYLVYGVFAHVTPFKGHLQCVKAFASVADELRKAKVRLRLFGGKVPIHEAYYQSVLAEIRDCGVEDIISFPGFSDNPEREMSRVNLVVCFDVTGKAWHRDVIEAMSLGRPVLAAGDEECFVINGRTGMLTPKGDIEAFAHGMVTLADKTTLERLGQGAYEFAVENFDSEINGTRIVECLERVAGLKA